jgi:hypothetical protein
MDERTLRALLEQVQRGETGVEEALAALRRLPFEDLGFARVDTHRALRAGVPEVVYCEGKRPEHAAAIIARLAEGSGPVLGTRAAFEVYARVRAITSGARYSDVARMVIVEREPLPKRPGTVLVICAGTADLPVAEEAALTAEVLGNGPRGAGAARHGAGSRRGDGGCPAQRGGRAGPAAADRRADQRGLWCEFRGPGRPAGDA